MKNLKIGAKILMGFSCIIVFLLAITATTMVSSFRTGSNIDTADIYMDMQNSANELIHILNETRITSAIFYETHSAHSYADMSKQLMYCDFRLKKLYEYVDSHPELLNLRGNIEEFDTLYSQWRTGLAAMGSNYNLEGELSEQDMLAFTESANDMRRVNLLAHEVLSNTISFVGEISDRKTNETKTFHTVALWIVSIISATSLLSAIFLIIVIIRSIAPPIGYMRDILNQIGKTGDLRVSDEIQEKLQAVTKGRDEPAQCTSALLVLLERLHSIDELLSYVADGDLTVDVSLQSEQDTMGLAVEKMLQNLNHKFGTIAKSTNSVKQKAEELSDGSKLLSDGSKVQAESVEHLSISLSQIEQKIKNNTEFAQQTASLTDDIQENANSGTAQMGRMTQASMDINAASQSIAKVIKVIDDLAFQTNILALNAAVEAARAGQHGKGFAVVADEVRNLANKSAEAAKDTGTLIENTIQKAALGASIAEETSESLGKIVQGVQTSSSLISKMTALSQEQSADIHQIIIDVEHVEKVVEQNNTIAYSSAEAAGEISHQSGLLNELVGQFRLLDTSLTAL